MQGQWVGEYDSQNSGEIAINIDALPNCFSAIAYLHPNGRSIPSMVVRFRTKDRAPRQSVHTGTFYPLHPETGAVVAWEAIKDRFPASTLMSQRAEIKCEYTDDKLSLRWGTDIGLIGQCTLQRSKASQPSDIEAKQMSWQAFKAYIEGIRGRKLIFRGQSQPWRLRTSFHRQGRADLERYVQEDLPQLHKYLTARTRHVFDLTDHLQLGAFLGLAQHHGYPTPLLDWTASPYVAAFFAFRGARDHGKSNISDRVRILAFDQDRWMGISPLPQFHPFVLPRLQVSLVDFLAIENERMIPQQGISLQSNIDDIETYVRNLEKEFNETLLEAFDLPLSDRNDVIQELRYMGITAASMFPGLDGMCEELKERNFPR